MDDKKYVAGDGKVWMHKESGVIGGQELMLGVNDSIDNWEQVDNTSKDE